MELREAAQQATPREQLLKELMDSRVPKTEREHAAAREIERLRAAGQQALEALCLPCDRWNRRQTEIINASITTLRAALAEDAMQRLTDVQQEMNCYGDGNVYRGQRSKDSQTPTLTINWMPAVEGPLSKAHRISQEFRQVEPVAYMMVNKTHGHTPSLHFTPPENWHVTWEAVPLYTAPPKREPLTEKEIGEIFISHGRDQETFARAIERAHGIGG